MFGHPAPLADQLLTSRRRQVNEMRAVFLSCHHQPGFRELSLCGLCLLAVTELVEAIEGNTKPKEIVLPAKLIKRGSVANILDSK